VIKITKKNKKSHLDYSWITSIYRFFGLNIAKIISIIPISPNQVTILSLIFGLIGSVYLCFGEFWYYLIGALLHQISITLDYVDGSLARLRGQTSKFGGWLDGNIDKFLDGVFFTAVSWGAYLQYKEPLLFIMALIAIITRYMIIHSVDMVRYGLDVSNLSPKFKKGVLGESMKKISIAKQLIYGKNNIQLLFIVFIFIGRIDWYLYLVAVYGLLSYLASLYIIGKQVRKLDKK